MKQYNEQERTNKQRTSTTHEGLHTNATRGVRPTPKTRRVAIVVSRCPRSFSPHEMALEFVYWAEGVRRPSPQTPPGQGRVRGRLLRLLAPSHRRGWWLRWCLRTIAAGGGLSVALQALQLFRYLGSQAYA